MIIVFSIALLICLTSLLHGLSYGSEVERKFPPAGQFCSIQGYKIHYMDLNAEARERPPVVLMHGVSCSLLDMREALGFLAVDRRVILIDRPGCGYSDRPEGADRLGTQSQILSSLLKEIEAEKPIVIGHSFGGAVALNFALDHPEDLAGLLLLAPPSHRWPGGVAAYNHLASMPVLGWLFRHTLIPLYGRALSRKAVSAAFWPVEAPEGYFDKAGMPLIFRPDAFLASAQDITALYNEVTRMEPRYPEISCPVRMIAGTHDTAVLSTIHCMSLKREIAGATLRYVHGVGHPVHHGGKEAIIEELEALDKAITKAITETPPPPLA